MQYCNLDDHAKTFLLILLRVLIKVKMEGFGWMTSYHSVYSYNQLGMFRHRTKYNQSPLFEFSLYYYNTFLFLTGIYLLHLIPRNKAELLSI